MPSTYSPSVGRQVVLAVDPTDASIFTTVVEVVDKLDQSAAKRVMANTSLLGDLWDSYMPCSGDPGSFATVIAFDPADTDAYGIFATSLNTGSRLHCQLTITKKDATTSVVLFHGYVESMGRVFEKDKMNQCPVSIKIDGNPNM